MTDTEHFDFISLGSGEAGKYIAWTIASKGKTVAVIEEKWVGGSCPNVACLPSKNVIFSAHVAHNARSTSYGLQSTNAPADMKAVIDRKRAMVNAMVEVHRGKFASSGAKLISGRGRFVGPKTIEVITPDGQRRTLTADTVVVNTGSRAVVDERISGLKEAKPLTHVEFLELETLPSHLIVLGGGYVGLELAQAARRLGAQVSVIEHNARVLKKEDPDVSELLQSLLAGEGIKFYTNAKANAITGESGSEVTVEGVSGATPFTIKGSHILAAAGRLPNTEDIGLETSGIKVTASKHVKVDEHLRTTYDGVFAVGDCAGSPYFTHAGFDDFRIVVNQLVGNGQKSTKGRHVASCIFTSPEVAQAGLREEEAKRAGNEYRLAKVPMTVFLRTNTLGDGESQGFAKALIAPDDTILGFTAIGTGVGELLPAIQLAMQEKITYDKIRDMILVHPTLNEGLVGLFMAVPPKN
jgi:pyruvate/2-oxoglutarate dehydrogenase complex dihydrolipoamide dehydrogenase (E3) component